MASSPCGVAPMPLKRAKVPSPRRKKRSIGSMRSMAPITVELGVTARADSAWRIGRRSTRSSSTAPGSRETWPPSGSTWRSSVRSSPRRAMRSSRSWPEIDTPAATSARRACSCGSVSGMSSMPARRRRTSRPSAFRKRSKNAPSQPSRIKGDCDSHDNSRRAATSGRRAIGESLPLVRIQSSTRARAFWRAMTVSAARRWRSQPKPCSTRSHSSVGGSTSKGERPPTSTTWPENTKTPP